MKGCTCGACWETFIKFLQERHPEFVDSALEFMNKWIEFKTIMQQKDEVDNA